MTLGLPSEVRGSLLSGKHQRSGSQASKTRKAKAEAIYTKQGGLNFDAIKFNSHGVNHKSSQVSVAPSKQEFCECNDQEANLAETKKLNTFTEGFGKDAPKFR